MDNFNVKSRVMIILNFKAIYHIDAQFSHFPIYAKSGINRSDEFVNILLTKAFSRKHLKEKC